MFSRKRRGEIFSPSHHCRKTKNWSTGNRGGVVWISARNDTDFDFEDLITRHGSAMLRVARRYGRSAADAEDVFQRAFEILLTSPPRRSNADDLLPWLLTVVKNEALMDRRKHRRIADFSFEEMAGDWESVVDGPDDRVIAFEDRDHRREALLRIGSDQARCLLLRADGLSYAEISELTGFSYHKVHRSLIDGRRVYRGLLAKIDSGAECRRLEPLISRLVDGELSDERKRVVEVHLSNCISCRATRRAFAEVPREVASFFPVAAAAGGGGFTGISRQFDIAAAWLHEKVVGPLSGAPVAEALFGKKLIVATAIVGATVAGGVGVEGVVISGHQESAARSASAGGAFRTELKTTSRDFKADSEVSRAELADQLPVRDLSFDDLVRSGLNQNEDHLGSFGSDETERDESDWDSSGLSPNDDFAATDEPEAPIPNEPLQP